MRTVWKFILALVDGPQVLSIPQGAKIVHVDEQDNQLCIWAELDPDQPIENRTFIVQGTGHPFWHDGTYVGTGLTYGGQLVWHAYELEHQDG